MMFDAFAFGVSTFCVWISIGILMKKHRFWHRFCCFYLRRVDFFVSRTTSTSCMSEPHHEVPKILKNWKNDQNERKFLFYFSELRGRGKSSAMISEVKLTHFLILFFFGVSKWGSDMRRAEISGKNHISVYKLTLTVSKNWSFLKNAEWKLRLHRNAIVFERWHFGGDFNLCLAGWLAGLGSHKRRCV